MTARSLFSHLEPELSVKAALLGMVALQGLDNIGSTEKVGW